MNQQVIKEMLHQLGCKVAFADNGIKTVNYFRGKTWHPFDLILMDCQMPVMDGYAATEHLKKIWKINDVSIPIIALTAATMLEDKKNVQRLGWMSF